jgi:TonB family protein
MPRNRVLISVLLLSAVSVACIGDKETKVLREGFEAAARRPDELPVMLNKRPPFQYPAAMLAKKVQANVTLRIHINVDGRVVPESTTVAESSKVPELDSAAVRGARDLRFVPAKKRGQPIAVSLNFPVFFRAPGEPPLPGDTILRATPTGLRP